MKRALTLVGAALALLAVTPVASAAAGDTPSPSVERVLIVTLPGVVWADLDDVDLPNLDRLLDESAVGDLTTRANPSRRFTNLGDGYITIGAGTRAIGDNGLTDGQALEVDERFGLDTAGDVFELRTGQAVERGIVQLSISTITTRNEPLLLDSEPGALGTTLAEAGYERAVIANGDGTEPPGVPPVYRRSAASALMDEGGVVPAGAVGDEILVEDARAPFGIRYDNDRVLSAFRDVWNTDSVVLVEASDLTRADAYRELATPDQGDRLWADALRQTDELVGGLLADVDPDRDAVLVLGPAHPDGELALTVAALRAPGVEPGLLRSATTRRSGFVQSIDVAPTVLDLLDVDRPSSMSGRPFEVGRQGGDAADRRDSLVDADEVARFVADRVEPVATVFVLLDFALVVGVLLWLRGLPRGVRMTELLGFAALALLGWIPSIYLARLIPFHEMGAVAYWLFLVLASLTLAAAYRAIGRRHQLDALILAAGTTVGVLVVDVLFGAPLQISSALGNSPIVGGRFTGYGNLAYSALAASGLVLAVLLAARLGRPVGPRVAVGVLGLVIVVDGAPWWGSDVGGVLSMVPAYLVTAGLLLGARIRLRTASIAVAAAVGAFFAFGFLDLARPADSRTHLGRLFEKVADEGVSSFITTIERKLSANFRNVTTTIWMFVVPIAALLVLILVLWSADRLRTLRDRYPELQAGAIGAVVLVVVGFAVNDSGIKVPGVMLTVFDAALVVLVTSRAAARPVPRRAVEAKELVEV
jgi:hypothetical protein